MATQIPVEFNYARIAGLPKALRTIKQNTRKANKVLSFSFTLYIFKLFLRNHFQYCHFTGLTRDRNLKVQPCVEWMQIACIKIFQVKTLIVSITNLQLPFAFCQHELLYSCNEEDTLPQNSKHLDAEVIVQGVAVTLWNASVEPMRIKIYSK